MSSVAGYLDYPNRRKGLDHDRFDYRDLQAADLPRTWPNGASLAVNISVYVEFFPMDMPREPILPSGGMQRPGTSFWDYTLRDYGNRVAIYRLIRAFKRLDLPATFAVNSEVAERYPQLIDELVAQGHEIAACGVDMGQLHYGDMDTDYERDLITRSRETLRRITKSSVSGWYSPGNTQAIHTQELVTEAGFEYLSDWANDDLPFWMISPAGRIVSMPLNLELSDRRFLFEQNQALREWELRTVTGVDVLLRESRERGIRQASLNLTPWIIGQPYRMGALMRVLESIRSRDGLWIAPSIDIANAWRTLTP